MSDPYERMNASGIELPPRPRPSGSYATGEVFGGLVFASGQTPTRDGVPAYRGRVETALGVEEGYAAARLAALTCVAELGAVSGDLRREIFGYPGVHARTAMGVQSVPGGAPVEV